MNKKIILLLIVIFFVSCTRISFLHTISDIGENKIFKKEVLGKWSQSGEKDKEIILIDSSQSEGSGLVYRIKIFGTEDKFDFGDSSFFIGELFEVEGKHFMMIGSDYEHRMFKEMGMYNMATVIPTFYVIRFFTIEKDKLEIGVLDGDAFMELVKEKKFNFKHEVIEADKDGKPDDVIVFEKSGELKKKLVELDKFPEVYERTVYHKIK